VLIPSFNPGGKVRRHGARRPGTVDPVWVVVDGSTAAPAVLEEMARTDPGLRVLVRATNGGKGAALLDGLREARRAGSPTP